MADVVFEYPDGRGGQTSVEGFAKNHEPYGAVASGYVGADGNTYPYNADGLKQANKATDARWTAINEETAQRQAADKATPSGNERVPALTKEEAADMPKVVRERGER